MMVVGWWSNTCQGAEMALLVKHHTGTCHVHRHDKHLQTALIFVHWHCLKLSVCAIEVLAIFLCIFLAKNGALNEFISLRTPVDKL